MTKEITEKLTIEKAFELLFTFFPKYIDYFESDIGAFLTYKFFKKYRTYISFRIITILLFLTSIFIFTFSEVNFIKGTAGYFMLIPVFGFFYIDRLIQKKYKYTTHFFHAIAKKLTRYKIKLDLLLNNTYLTEKYFKGKPDFETTKNKSNKIKERIENDIGFIKSYSYYIKKFTLPTILFTPLITLFITFIYDLFQNPIPVNMDIIPPTLTGIVSSVLVLYLIISSTITIRKERKINETSIYTFFEGEIFMLLEFIRLQLRIFQFPNEEKLKKGLLDIQEQISKNLKSDSAKN